MGDTGRSAQALFGYIEGYYNRHRMHSAVGYLTPEQA
jgi:transposase InsO family protein